MFAHKKSKRSKKASGRSRLLRNNRKPYTHALYPSVGCGATASLSIDLGCGVIHDISVSSIGRPFQIIIQTDQVQLLTCTGSCFSNFQFFISLKIDTHTIHAFSSDVLLFSEPFDLAANINTPNPSIFTALPSSNCSFSFSTKF